MSDWQAAERAYDDLAVQAGGVLPEPDCVSPCEGGIVATWAEDVRDVSLIRIDERPIATWNYHDASTDVRWSCEWTIGDPLPEGVAEALAKCR